VQISLRGVAIALAIAAVACAPAVDGPAERQRALDREDGARIAAQLAMLPGVVRAEAQLRRAPRDPLAAGRARPAAAPAAASIVIVTDDRADRAAIAGAARAIARAIAPEVAAPALVVEAAAIRPRLAKVGPFTVEAGSQVPLRAALAAALALIAALAAWIALGQRRGSSAQ
jgi:hypothetical protein